MLASANSSGSIFVFVFYDSIGNWNHGEYLLKKYVCVYLDLNKEQFQAEWNPEEELHLKALL